MTIQKNHIPWIEESDPLPPAQSACTDASSGLQGLVAAGGGLSVKRLIEAYSQGMFPWYSEGQPILWWSPSPRMVLQVDNFKLHRSLRKTLQKFVQMPNASIRFDTAFDRVIAHCSSFDRPGQNGTWILQDMVLAYQALHRAGFASDRMQRPIELALDVRVTHALRDELNFPGMRVFEFGFDDDYLGQYHPRQISLPHSICKHQSGWYHPDDNF